jgi:predicted Na+-dependent transporter
MSLNPSLIVTITLFSVMLALGLSLRPDSMHHWRSRPALPLRVLLGSCLLVPMAGLLLLKMPWSWELSRPARHAIALMAVCPSAPLALRKAGTSGGDRQLAALLQVSAALAAILTIPVLALLFRQTFDQDGWLIRPMDVALQVGKVQVLPLLLGVLLRQKLPRLAERIERPLETLANGLLLLLMVVVLLKAGPLLLTVVPQAPGALAAMALLIAVSLGLGRLLGGEHPREGLTTALVTAMRNPGLALLFAGQHGQDLPGLKVWILAYVLVTLLLSIPLVRLERHRESA